MNEFLISILGVYAVISFFANYEQRKHISELYRDIEEFEKKHAKLIAKYQVLIDEKQKEGKG